jgi:Ser/Thr protein kinase RdoA (MazF antagonist)
MGSQAPYGDEPGEPLLGGDVSDGVVRVGATVRRPPTAASAMVRRVLEHLESTGFDGVPRWLGQDALGRHVLTFVSGEVAGRPWPSWVGDAERAASVARLARRLDDAMSPLGVPVWAADQRPPELSGMPPSIAPPPEFLCHLDITPENVVFRDGRAEALIDFDLVRPASAPEEVVNLLLWWAGWMAPEDREAALRDVDPASRGRILVDAYGLDLTDRALLPALALNSAQRAWHTMRWRSERLGGGWRRMWDTGVEERIRRREGWLRERQDELGSALLDED